MEGSPEGARIFTAMMAVVHQYDRTRPITCAMDSGWLKPGFANVEDIIGVNYNYGSYDAVHAAHPHTPMFGSETANNKTARSEYAYDRTNGWVSARSWRGHSPGRGLITGANPIPMAGRM
jgi:beta-galactosidase